MGGYGKFGEGGVKLHVGDLVRLIPRLRYVTLFTLSDPLDEVTGGRLNPGDFGLITREDPRGLRYEILVVGEGGTFTGYIHPNWVEVV